MILPAPRSTAHLYEIQGYGRPVRTRRVGRRWVPLYQYRQEHEAKRVLRILTTLTLADLIHKDAFFRAWDIDDFRIVPADPKADYNYQRKALRKGHRSGPVRRRRARVEAPRQRAILGRSGVRLRGPRAVVVGRERRG